MLIRLASAADRARIIEIYNASIPVDGRRPILSLSPSTREMPGLPSMSSRTGRSGSPSATARSSLALAERLPPARRLPRDGRGGGVRGAGGAADGRWRRAPPPCDRRRTRAGVRTLVWVTFAANPGSVRLAERAGFSSWGLLPRVTELDGERLDVAILGSSSAEPGAGLATCRRQSSRSRRRPRSPRWRGCP